jgi:hypothetical protein
MNEPNIDYIASFTGKLNRVEKIKVRAALTAQKSIGEILDEIAIYRQQVQTEEKIQDKQNSKIKNSCPPNIKINHKLPNNTITPFEQQKRNIRAITDDYINLQKKRKEP